MRLAIHTARLYGPAAVVAIDRVPGRLELAAKLGATHVAEAGGDVAAVVAEVTDGQGATGVVEAVGSPATIAQAVSLAGVGGRVAVVGIAPSGVELPLPEMLFRNVTLWTGLGDLSHLDTLMDLTRRGVVAPASMLTHRATLDEIAEAFGTFSDPASGVVKYHIATRA